MRFKCENLSCVPICSNQVEFNGGFETVPLLWAIYMEEAFKPADSLISIKGEKSRFMTMTALSKQPF